MQAPMNRNHQSQKQIAVAIGRLETFLSYISDKIKSNTVKMQASFENMNDMATKHMETISESELSINEDQLNTFNEFMIAQERYD